VQECLFDNGAEFGDGAESSAATEMERVEFIEKEFWGGRWGSNPRPSVPQTDVLPLNYAHHPFRTNYLLLYVAVQTRFCVHRVSEVFAVAIASPLQ
jgi:hypothetical protein